MSKNGLCRNVARFDQRLRAEDVLQHQIEERAVVGPAAKLGVRLESLPCTVLPFGEWKLLQDFLANPADVNGTAQRLEAAAAAAYKG